MTPTVACHASSDKTAIRPFHVNVPEAELTELHRRIKPTKWPERETVTDASQGVQLATIQALARYWATEYDWRKIEAKMNALPQFHRPRHYQERDLCNMFVESIRSMVCSERVSDFARPVKMQ
jgi:Epoxide hydrolase N terminus